MAVTQDDIDALDSAFVDARGAQTISFEGQSVTLNSYSEYLKFRAFLVRRLNSARTYRLAATDKGM